MFVYLSESMTMKMIMDTATPIFESVVYDLEIFPEDQMGHDLRVVEILHKNRSEILDDRGNWIPEERDELSRN